ncbi:MAG: knotted carbamoyltransferase YgeW [Deltaproteobacteria bacterium HGW-Deltaproteobacteria-14]|nr:MAG: knotted carbamoyltransferase YgeW [Deltaproteobacteria bacterium HGW-Deltaproteobacteria-14]
MSQNVAELLEKAVATPFFGESMLLTQDWDDQRLGSLIALAELFAELDRRGVKTPLCPSELAYAMFFDNSTRTKSAWAGAAARLGMAPVIVDGSSTQVSHGETAVETGAMLGMNSHAMGIRHDLILGEGNLFMRDAKQGIDDYLAATEDPRKVPIVNLQCDIDHPTQVTADLLWLRERFPEGLAGKKIAMTWAYSPSYAKPLSVPQGIIMLMTRFGADVTLAHPDGYQLLPETVAHAAANAKASGGSFRITGSMDDAFAGADVVYPKSWGAHDLMLERVAANKRGDKAEMASIEKRALARNAEHTDWICDERRMATTAGGDALYMHCLPADIGAEVTPGVMDLHKVNVALEAQKKVYVVMALLAGGKIPDLKAAPRNGGSPAGRVRMTEDPRRSP